MQVQAKELITIEAPLSRYKDRIRPDMSDTDIEKLAREASQARRDLGVKYKDVTPQPLRDYIYYLNTKRYGDPLGPKYDQLVSGASKRLSKILGRAPTPREINEYIIGGAARPNSDINSLLSNFSKWLDTKPDSYIESFG